MAEDMTCQTSRTLPRRVAVRVLGKIRRPRTWLGRYLMWRMVIKIMVMADWVAVRAEDVALVLEDDL
jgi:hypothetical protein